jgi:hypothetical protein
MTTTPRPKSVSRYASIAFSGTLAGLFIFFFAQVVMFSGTKSNGTFSYTPIAPRPSPAAPASTTPSATPTSSSSSSEKKR